MALVVTSHARDRGLPLDPASLITVREGQVLGLGKAAVQATLLRHGITKVLAKEGGRTSRGSLGNMRTYIAFLNELALRTTIDFDVVESFWIERVQAHFAAKPFLLRIDPSLSVRGTIRALIDQVESRQRDSDGAMIVGTVMQHLVGAKLQTALTDRVIIEHNGSNANDAKSRGGDFDLGDCSVHVTTAPGQAVMDRCRENLDAGRKPIIVTTRRRVEMADALADDNGIRDRLDIIEFEQFMATNIHELGAFEASGRTIALASIIAAYNDIIDQYETDPSLRIEVAASR